MAFDTSVLKKKAIEAVNKYGIIFIEEVAAAIGVSKQTFYNHHLDEVDEIKDALSVNRFKLKAGLRKKWYESENATSQIALYRLLSTPEELSRLTSQKLEHSGEVGLNSIEGFKIIIDDTGN